MILTIDVGNSNTVIVGYEKNQIVYKERINTEKNNVASYYTSQFESLDCDMEAVILSSVVPNITDTIISVLTKQFACSIDSVSIDNVQNFDVKLDNPKEIGADFIATAVGAFSQYQAPIIIADIGSASKISVVDSEGAFSGGVIIPGIQTSLDALVHYIPHLPTVALEVPPNVIGTNTQSCIQSGITYGLVAQIQGLATMMEKELGMKCTKIITGGYAQLIHYNLPDFIHKPDLLNDGLRILYQNDYFKSTSVSDDNE
ncbi:type III pantothenate kinase [Erysipelothrix amsterdamensis]|uniref:Type III pantothenate kinase n=1 Tax=Erysipelothrix amsterdamensis TaxID=2929157 RepID=A0AAU9VHF8_9FIRM|nr:type III pantothenate kinase [Erysipelothrix rhusiopathiae]MCG4436929.1 type III pantothenate kinase [Erysipelothrix rhusiopathiae]CAH2761046.1 type III pantothenate kinase [Erysipelothrix sp. A18Y020d]CAH2761057.1 type III pantothenate kinase [Erysipelothrix sp. A18Y020d]